MHDLSKMYSGVFVISLSEFAMVGFIFHLIPAYLYVVNLMWEVTLGELECSPDCNLSESFQTKTIFCQCLNNGHSHLDFPCYEDGLGYYRETSSEVPSIYSLCFMTYPISDAFLSLLKCAGVL